MTCKNKQSLYLKISYSCLLIFCLILPISAFAAISELRLKTLLNICEAAQSNGDSGTIKSIAQQLKAVEIDAGSKLRKEVSKCIDAGFPPDEESANFEDLIVEINKLQTELRALCFDLLELKPTQAITFEPCNEFY